MYTPPPNAKCAMRVSNSVEVVTPPLIVTPLIATVGGSGANGAPMVSTGPPPWMLVRCAPAPRSSTLTSIFTPPRYTPGAIRIVSPSWAASTACWSLSKHPGRWSTQKVAARAGPAAVPMRTSVAARARWVRFMRATLARAPRENLVIASRDPARVGW